MSDDRAAGHRKRTGRGTADAAEVDRFAAAAERWWDEDGEFRPLHRLNPPRLRFVRDALIRHFALDPDRERPLNGLSVLDVGCGGGLVSEPLARLGADVLGIDAGEETVATAEAHARGQGLSLAYRTALPEDLAAAGMAFDAVVSLEVVEHVADLDAFLAALARLTRPGGIVILATINRTLKSLALAKVGAEYILRWVPAGTHDWQKFVRPAELADKLAAHGMRQVDRRGVVYNPLSDDWQLSRDTDVNYLASFAREA